MTTKKPRVDVGIANLRKFAMTSCEAADNSPPPPSDVSPLELAQVRAGIEKALMLLDDAEASGKPSPFAIDHGPTSLLQSFLAEQAKRDPDKLAADGHLAPTKDGGFEAKFDERADLGGWALSVFSWWRGKLDKHEFLPPARGARGRARPQADRAPRRLGDGAIRRAVLRRNDRANEVP